MHASEIDLTGLEFPIMLHAASRVSDEDLLRFSEQNRLYRIERTREGDLMMTPVNGVGGTHEYYVDREFANWTERDGRGRGFMANTGFSLPDGSCLSPDAAWVPKARWQALTRAQRRSYPPLCPNFLIEIRSLSDPRRMIESKMQTWIDLGAELAWLIDPIKQEVLIYEPGKPVMTLVRPDVIVATAPVEGFTLDLRPLWEDEDETDQ